MSWPQCSLAQVVGSKGGIQGPSCVERGALPQDASLGPAAPPHACHLPNPPWSLSLQPPAGDSGPNSRVGAGRTVMEGGKKKKFCLSFSCSIPESMSVMTQGHRDIKRIDFRVVSSWHFPFVSLMFVIRGQKRSPIDQTLRGERAKGLVLGRLPAGLVSTWPLCLSGALSSTVTRKQDRGWIKSWQRSLLALFKWYSFTKWHYLIPILGSSEYF